MNEISELNRRLAFCEMDQDAIAILKAQKQFIIGVLPKNMDRYFDNVSKDPEATAYYRDTETMNRIKAALLKHWSLVLDGRYDTTYEASIVEIGELHASLGPPHWFVYGYLNLLSSLVAVAVADLPTGRLRGASITRRANLAQAINKAGLFDVACVVTAFRNAANRARATMINRLVDQIESATNMTVAAVTQAAVDLQAVAGIMTGEAETTSARANAVVHAAETASSNVNAVAGATEEFTPSVKEISQRINESVRTNEIAVELARETAENVTRLSGEAQRIGDIVRLIAGIADQTNLLALNATIEAARAGDAGKGFAVVAQEVKSLATQTAKATAQISDQIANIQSSTTETVSAIERITSVIGNMNEISGAIAAAATQQDATANEIARNINEASGGTSDVASNIAEVTKTADKTRNTADRVLMLAQSVSEQADHLNREMAKFIRTARAA